MDNLISRQAAIDAVEHITSSMSVCVNTDECYGMKRMQRRAVIELTNLPSVQPERKTGKWIDDNIFGQLPVIVCDQCKVFFPLQFGASHNFCPNCGADMRGEQDD